MKFLMRETFANPSHIIHSYGGVHQLKDQSIFVSLAMPNHLQDYEQTQEDKDDAKEIEELTTSWVNSEPSPHNAPITLNENMNIDTEGDNYIDVLKFFHKSCYHREIFSGIFS